MKKIIPVIAAITLFSGACILLYYPVRGMYEEWRQERAVLEFEENYLSFQENKQTERTYLSDLYGEMLRYNRTIAENGQSGLKDAWSYEDEVFDLREYGLDADVAGVIEIPAMDTELPLYLGADSENMAKGAAVLGQTSMPIGGRDTNCVIAAHRGYGSAAMFREIERLRIGDKIYIHNMWEVLEYSVVEVDVILPDDVDAVHIQEGRDLITLITCHPYGQNSHRYIVRCERTADAADYTDGETELLTENEEAGISEEKEHRARLQMTAEKWLPLLAVPLVAAAFFMIFITRGRKCGENEDENKKES